MASLIQPLLLVLFCVSVVCLTMGHQPYKCLQLGEQTLESAPHRNGNQQNHYALYLFCKSHILEFLRHSDNVINIIASFVSDYIIGILNISVTWLQKYPFFHTTEH